MPDSEQSDKTTISLTCKRCNRSFAVGSATVCPEDGSELAPANYESLIGKTFAEKYEIQSILGMGGMSIVYKARHLLMGRTVAVKLLLQERVSDPHAIKRFQQEAEAASSLSHQNIVIVHDFGINNSGQPYFIMDCLEGPSLEEYIDKNGRMPLDKATDIFKQICDGLQHAHKKGIVHRDLKPSNVVLVKEEDGSDIVKIVDFGLARVVREDENKPRLTQTGEILGSPLYMSPEQFQGHQLDARSDIYSMGCLMYETLAGAPAFYADSFFNMALLHIHQKPPSFSEISPNPQIPEPMEQVVLKCMAKDPDQRFQNVEQLRQKILDAALASGVPGLKAGAVKVPSNDNQSAFKKTWENMKAVIDTEFGAEQKRKRTAINKTVAVAIASSMAVAVSIFFFWPGIDGDIGTPFDKLRWQGNLWLADRSADSGNFHAAIEYMNAAKKVARTFGDNHARLKLTVEHQANIYHRANKFAEEEQANQEAANLLTASIAEEARGVEKDLRSIATGGNSDTQRMANQMDATASLNKIIVSSKRLKSRALFTEDEELLKLSIETFEKLGLSRTDQMAELKLALAENYIAQQRLTLVRPLLEQAYENRKAVAGNSTGSLRAIKNLIKTELKLGQFDRDQSNYDKADDELKDAMTLAEKNFSADRLLMTEAINSYADLARQRGDKKMRESLLQNATRYSQ